MEVLLGARAGGAPRPHFSAVAAPIENPLPLWILYPLFFVAVYLSHWPLLRLPFFWDEAGYYIPAALDFFRTGSLIPHSTLTNAHPPLPSILLAAWWHVGGLAISGTRTFLAMIAAAALLGAFRLARQLAGSTVAALVTLLTALYPVWFAQSTMAHADLFAAAFTLWALSYYFSRYVGGAAGPGLIASASLFSLAALAKETAIVTPLVLALWEFTLLVTEARGKQARARLAWLAALLVPVLPLAGWYAYHFHVTGFVFGNPEFLRYNATANFGAARVAVSLWHRLIHLTVHMNLYVPVVATMAALQMPRQGVEAGTGRFRPGPAAVAIGIVLAGNALAFSVLGGALLTRYLLPMYPLVLLLCVTVWQSRGPRVLYGLSALTAAAFLAGLFFNPPYSFAPEDNLTYRDFVLLHASAIAVISHRFPEATVLSAWPATAEMQHPELGYTSRPIKTVAIDDFDREQIEHAAQDPGAYDTALVFSTKWVPLPGHFSLSHTTEGSDTRFFDFHRDLNPRQIAELLHGDVVWQASRNGEWAAVLRFPRSLDARLWAPASRP